MKNTTVKRTISFFLLIFYVVSYHTDFSAFAFHSVNLTSSEHPEKDLSRIQIPADYGSLEEIFKAQPAMDVGGQETGGKGQKNSWVKKAPSHAPRLMSRSPFVILIQDAHAIPSAQRNIWNIIRHLEELYGVRQVAAEGVSTELDTRIFKSFPDKERLAKVMEGYMDAGELSGVSAAAIFSKTPTHYQGIEDWKLYEEGLKDYQEAMEQEPRISAELEKQKKALEEERKKHYSKSLLEIDRALESYETNHAQLAEVLKLLARVKRPESGSQLLLILEAIEKPDRDHERIDREVRSLAEKVRTSLRGMPQHAEAISELGLPRRSFGPPRNDDEKYFQERYQAYLTSKIPAEAFAWDLKELLPPSVHFSKHLTEAMEKESRLRNLSGPTFFKEFESYVASVKAKLFRNEKERELDVAMHHLKLMKRFSKLELTREEWEEIKAVKRETSFVKREIDRDSLFQAHLSFYENSEERDDAFFKNLRFTLHDSRATILVAGGFHTQALIQKFKEQGISYALVLPRIESIPEKLDYREQMQGHVSWEDYFRNENGRVNLYAAFVRGARDKLLNTDLTRSGNTEARGSGFDPSMLKAWRDQILRDLVEKEEITRAGEYTPLLDELAGDERRETGDALRAQWLANIDKFVSGLKGLETRGELTEKNILKLLQPSTMTAAPSGPSQVGGSNAWLSSNRFAKFRNKPVLRSEVRTAEKPSITSKTFEEYVNAERGLISMQSAARHFDRDESTLRYYFRRTIDVKSLRQRNLRSKQKLIPIIVGTDNRLTRIQKILEIMEEHGGEATLTQIANGLNLQGKIKRDDLFASIDLHRFFRDVNHNQRVRGRPLLRIKPGNESRKDAFEKRKARLLPVLESFHGLASAEELGRALRVPPHTARSWFRETNWIQVNKARKAAGLFPFYPRLIRKQQKKAWNRILAHVESNAGMDTIQEIALDLDLSEVTVAEHLANMQASSVPEFTIWDYVNLVRQNKGLYPLEIYYKMKPGEDRSKMPLRLLRSDLKRVMPGGMAHESLLRMVKYYRERLRQRGYRSFRLFALRRIYDAAWLEVKDKDKNNLDVKQQIFLEKIIKLVIDEAPSGKIKTYGPSSRRGFATLEPSLNYYFQVEVPRAVNLSRQGISQRNLSDFAANLRKVVQDAFPLAPTIYPRETTKSSKRRSEARTSSHNELLAQLANERIGAKRLKIAKELGLFTPPAEFGLLDLLYIAHDMEVKKVVNPNSTLRRGRYRAAGMDLSNYLLSTNIPESDFEARYYKLTLDDLVLLKSNGGPQITVREATMYKSRYMEWKESAGYGMGETLENKEENLMALRIELDAMKINYWDIRPGLDSRGFPMIEFEWAYPGEKERTYRISFVDIDQGYTLRGPYDLYYQRAPLDIPFHYKDRKFKSTLESVIPRGFFVTDDYGIVVSGVGRKHFTDLSGTFPQVYGDEVPVPMPLEIEQAIFKMREHLHVGEPRNHEGHYYGWHVRVRQRPLKKRRSEARHLDRNSLIQKLATAEQDMDKYKLLYLLGLPILPFLGKLLDPLYILQNAETKKVINAANKLKRGRYNGAGADISNYLLSTNVTNSDFVAHYYGLTAEDLQRLKNPEDPFFTSLEAQTYEEQYRQWKYKAGYSGVELLDTKEKLLRALKIELYAMGVDLQNLVIFTDERGFPGIEFDWTYTGDISRTYTIHFVEVEQSHLLGGPYDLYYQRAGMELPSYYSSPEFQKIFESVVGGGYYVTDDYAVTKLDSGNNTNSGEIAFTDQSALFPPDYGYEIPVPMHQAVRDAILKKRLALYKIEPFSPPGLYYGWHLRVRKRPVLSRSEARTRTDDEERSLLPERLRKIRPSLPLFYGREYSHHELLADTADFDPDRVRELDQQTINLWKKKPADFKAKDIRVVLLRSDYTDWQKNKKNDYWMLIFDTNLSDPHLLAHAHLINVGDRAFSRVTITKDYRNLREAIFRRAITLSVLTGGIGSWRSSLAEGWEDKVIYEQMMGTKTDTLKDDRLNIEWEPKTNQFIITAKEVLARSGTRKRKTVKTDEDATLMIVHAGPIKREKGGYFLDVHGTTQEPIERILESQLAGRAFEYVIENHGSHIAPHYSRVQIVQPERNLNYRIEGLSGHKFIMTGGECSACFNSAYFYVAEHIAKFPGEPFEIHMPRDAIYENTYHDKGHHDLKKSGRVRARNLRKAAKKHFGVELLARNIPFEVLEYRKEDFVRISKWGGPARVKIYLWPDAKTMITKFPRSEMRIKTIAQIGAWAGWGLSIGLAIAGYHFYQKGLDEIAFGYMTGAFFAAVGAAASLAVIRILKTSSETKSTVDPDLIRRIQLKTNRIQRLSAMVRNRGFLMREFIVQWRLQDTIPHGTIRSILSYWSALKKLDDEELDSETPLEPGDVREYLEWREKIHRVHGKRFLDVIGILENLIASGALHETDLLRLSFLRDMKSHFQSLPARLAALRRSIETPSRSEARAAGKAKALRKSLTDHANQMERLIDELYKDIELLRFDLYRAWNFAKKTHIQIASAANLDAILFYDTKLFVRMKMRFRQMMRLLNRASSMYGGLYQAFEDLEEPYYGEMKSLLALLAIGGDRINASSEQLQREYDEASELWNKVSARSEARLWEKLIDLSHEMTLSTHELLTALFPGRTDLKVIDLGNEYPQEPNFLRVLQQEFRNAIQTAHALFLENWSKPVLMDVRHGDYRELQRWPGGLEFAIETEEPPFNGSYDLITVNVPSGRVASYLTEAQQLLRPGGVVLLRFHRQNLSDGRIWLQNQATQMGWRFVELLNPPFDYPRSRDIPGGEPVFILIPMRSESRNESVPSDRWIDKLVRTDAKVQTNLKNYLARHLLFLTFAILIARAFAQILIKLVFQDGNLTPLQYVFTVSLIAPVIHFMASGGWKGILEWAQTGQSKTLKGWRPWHGPYFPEERAVMKKLTRREKTGLILNGVVTHFLGTFLFFYAIRELAPHVAIIVTQLRLIISIILIAIGIRSIKERPTLKNIFGLALILTGVLTIVSDVSLSDSTENIWWSFGSAYQSSGILGALVAMFSILGQSIWNGLQTAGVQAALVSGIVGSFQPLIQKRMLIGSGRDKEIEKHMPWILLKSSYMISLGAIPVVFFVMTALVFAGLDPYLPAVLQMMARDSIEVMAQGFWNLLYLSPFILVASVLLISGWIGQIFVYRHSSASGFVRMEGTLPVFSFLISMGLRIRDVSLTLPHGIALMSVVIGTWFARETRNDDKSKPPMMELSDSGTVSARSEVRHSAAIAGTLAYDTLLQAWQNFDPHKYPGKNPPFDQTKRELAKSFGFKRPGARTVPLRGYFGSIPLILEDLEDNSRRHTPGARELPQPGFAFIRQVYSERFGEGYEVVVGDRGVGFPDEDGDGIPDLLRLVQHGQGGKSSTGLAHSGISNPIDWADEFEVISNGWRWTKGEQAYLTSRMAMPGAFGVPLDLWIGTKKELDKFKSPQGTLIIFRMWDRHPSYPASKLKNLDQWLESLNPARSEIRGQQFDTSKRKDLKIIVVGNEPAVSFYETGFRLLHYQQIRRVDDFWQAIALINEGFYPHVILADRKRSPISMSHVLPFNEAIDRFSPPYGYKPLLLVVEYPLEEIQVTSAIHDYENEVLSGIPGFSRSEVRKTEDASEIPSKGKDALEMARVVTRKLKATERRIATVQDVWSSIRDEAGANKRGNTGNATISRSTLTAYESLVKAHLKKIGFPEFHTRLERSAVIHRGLTAAGERNPELTKDFSGRTGDNHTLHINVGSFRIRLPFEYTRNTTVRFTRYGRPSHLGLLFDATDAKNYIVFQIIGNDLWLAHSSESQLEKFATSTGRNTEVSLVGTMALELFDTGLSKAVSTTQLRVQHSFGFAGFSIYIRTNEGQRLFIQRSDGKSYQSGAEKTIQLIMKEGSESMGIRLRSYMAEAFSIDGLGWRSRRSQKVRPLIIARRNGNNTLNLNRIADMVKTGELQQLLDAKGKVLVVDRQMDLGWIAAPDYVAASAGSRRGKVSDYEIVDYFRDMENPLRLYQSGTILGQPGEEYESRSEARVSITIPGVDPASAVMLNVPENVAHDIARMTTWASYDEELTRLRGLLAEETPERPYKKFVFLPSDGGMPHLYLWSLEHFPELSEVLTAEELKNLQRHLDRFIRDNRAYKLESIQDVFPSLDLTKDPAGASLGWWAFLICVIGVDFRLEQKGHSKETPARQGVLEAIEHIIKGSEELRKRQVIGWGGQNWFEENAMNLLAGLKDQPAAKALWKQILEPERFEQEEDEDFDRIAHLMENLRVGFAEEEFFRKETRLRQGLTEESSISAAFPQTLGEIKDWARDMEGETLSLSRDLSATLHPGADPLRNADWRSPLSAFDLVAERARVVFYEPPYYPNLILTDDDANHWLFQEAFLRHAAVKWAFNRWAFWVSPHGSEIDEMSAGYTDTYQGLARAFESFLNESGAGERLSSYLELPNPSYTAESYMRYLEELARIRRDLGGTFGVFVDFGEGVYPQLFAEQRQRYSEFSAGQKLLVFDYASELSEPDGIYVRQMISSTDSGVSMESAFLHAAHLIAQSREDGWGDPHETSAFRMSLYQDSVRELLDSEAFKGSHDSLAPVFYRDGDAQKNPFDLIFVSKTKWHRDDGGKRKRKPGPRRSPTTVGGGSRRARSEARVLVLDQTLKQWLSDKRIGPTGVAHWIEAANGSPKAVERAKRYLFNAGMVPGHAAVHDTIRRVTGRTPQDLIYELNEEKIRTLETLVTQRQGYIPDIIYFRNDGTLGNFRAALASFGEITVGASNYFGVEGVRIMKESFPSRLGAWLRLFTSRDAEGIRLWILNTFIPKMRELNTQRFGKKEDVVPPGETGKTTRSEARVPNFQPLFDTVLERDVEIQPGDVRKIHLQVGADRIFGWGLQRRYLPGGSYELVDGPRPSGQPGDLLAVGIVVQETQQMLGTIRANWDPENHLEEMDIALAPQLQGKGIMKEIWANHLKPVLNIPGLTVNGKLGNDPSLIGLAQIVLKAQPRSTDPQLQALDHDLADHLQHPQDMSAKMVFMGSLGSYLRDHPFSFAQNDLAQIPVGKLLTYGGFENLKVEAKNVGQSPAGVPIVGIYLGGTIPKRSEMRELENFRNEPEISEWIRLLEHEVKEGIDLHENLSRIGKVQNGLVRQWPKKNRPQWVDHILDRLDEIQQQITSRAPKSKQVSTPEQIKLHASLFDNAAQNYNLTWLFENGQYKWNWKGYPAIVLSDPRADWMDDLKWGECSALHAVIGSKTGIQGNLVSFTVPGLRYSALSGDRRPAITNHVLILTDDGYVVDVTPWWHYFHPNGKPYIRLSEHPLRKAIEQGQRFSRANKGINPTADEPSSFGQLVFARRDPTVVPVVMRDQGDGSFIETSMGVMLGGKNADDFSLRFLFSTIHSRVDAAKFRQNPEDGIYEQTQQEIWNILIPFSRLEEVQHLIRVHLHDPPDAIGKLLRRNGILNESRLVDKRAGASPDRMKEIRTMTHEFFPLLLTFISKIPARSEIRNQKVSAVQVTPGTKMDEIKRHLDFFGSFFDGIYHPHASYFLAMQQAAAGKKRGQLRKWIRAFIRQAGLRSVFRKGDPLDHFLAVLQRTGELRQKNGASFRFSQVTASFRSEARVFERLPKTYIGFIPDKAAEKLVKRNEVGLPFQEEVDYVRLITRVLASRFGHGVGQSAAKEFGNWTRYFSPRLMEPNAPFNRQDHLDWGNTGWSLTAEDDPEAGQHFFIARNHPDLETSFWDQMNVAVVASSKPFRVESARGEDVPYGDYEAKIETDLDEISRLLQAGKRKQVMKADHFRTWLTNAVEKFFVFDHQVIPGILLNYRYDFPASQLDINKMLKSMDREEKRRLREWVEEMGLDFRQVKKEKMMIPDNILLTISVEILRNGEVVFEARIDDPLRGKQRDSEKPVIRGVLVRRSEARSGSQPEISDEILAKWIHENYIGSLTDWIADPHADEMTRKSRARRYLLNAGLILHHGSVQSSVRKIFRRESSEIIYEMNEEKISILENMVSQKQGYIPGIIYFNDNGILRNFSAALAGTADSLPTLVVQFFGVEGAHILKDAFPPPIDPWWVAFSEFADPEAIRLWILNTFIPAMRTLNRERFLAPTFPQFARSEAREDASAADFSGFERKVSEIRDRKEPIYLGHLAGAFSINLNSPEQARRLFEILEQYGYTNGPFNSEIGGPVYTLIDKGPDEKIPRSEARISLPEVLQKAGIDPAEFTTVIYPGSGNHDDYLLALFKNGVFPKISEYHLISYSYLDGAAGEWVKRNIFGYLNEPETADVNIYAGSYDQTDLRIHSRGKRIWLDKFPGEHAEMRKNYGIYRTARRKGHIRSGDLILTVLTGKYKPFPWVKVIASGIGVPGYTKWHWQLSVVTDEDIENIRTLPEQVDNKRSEARSTPFGRSGQDIESTGEVLDLSKTTDLSSPRRRSEARTEVGVGAEQSGANDLPPVPALLRVYWVNKGFLTAGDISGKKQRKMRIAETNIHQTFALRDWTRTQFARMLEFFPKEWGKSDPMKPENHPRERYHQHYLGFYDYLIIDFPLAKRITRTFDLMFEMDKHYRIRLRLMDPGTLKELKPDEIEDIVQRSVNPEAFAKFIETMQSGVSFREIFAEQVRREKEEDEARKLLAAQQQTEKNKRSEARHAAKDFVWQLHPEQNRVIPISAAELERDARVVMHMKVDEFLTTMSEAAEAVFQEQWSLRQKAIRSIVEDLLQSARTVLPKDGSVTLALEIPAQMETARKAVVNRDYLKIITEYLRGEIGNLILTGSAEPEMVTPLKKNNIRFGFIRDLSRTQASFALDPQQKILPLARSHDEPYQGTNKNIVSFGVRHDFDPSVSPEAASLSRFAGILYGVMAARLVDNPAELGTQNSQSLQRLLRAVSLFQQFADSANGQLVLVKEGKDFFIDSQAMEFLIEWRTQQMAESAA